MTIIETHRPYRFGSESGLSHRVKEHLADRFENSPKTTSTGILPGRGSVQYAELEPIGRVVIKTYFRGGLLRYVNQWTYIKTGKTRGQAEYERLQRIRRLGVNAPEPVAYVFRGRLFYHAWLITKELESVESMAEVALNAPDRIQQLLPTLISQMKRLINNRMHHKDMHPGNVLVTPDNQIYIIDFDKASKTRLTRKHLARRYCRRWQQAVAKYGLPRSLAIQFKEGLMEGWGSGRC